MTFAEKLRESRKASGLSQEELAERLNVSRQAVTKWETDKGIPDIANLMTISALFGIAVDDLVSDEKSVTSKAARQLESVTEYDIDGIKTFDLKLGSAREVSVTGGDGEKIKIIITSDTFERLREEIKTKIDDIRNRIDVDVRLSKSVSETAAKKEIFIEVILPNKYLGHVEIAANCQSLDVRGVECERIEIDGRMPVLRIASSRGTVEVNCNLDIAMELRDFTGTLEVNQLNATSRLSVPDGFEFRTSVRGHGNSVIFEEDGNPSQDFSAPDAQNIIELNGMRSELVIDRKKA